jgi:hypothetical protein
MRAYTLSEDYLTVDWQQSYPFAQGYAREAPALLKTEGVYFMLTSSQSGWNPNQGKYQTTTNLHMPHSVQEAAALGIEWDGDPEHWADATWTPMAVIGSCTTCAFVGVMSCVLLLCLFLHFFPFFPSFFLSFCVFFCLSFMLSLLWFLTGSTRSLQGSFR